MFAPPPSGAGLLRMEGVVTGELCKKFPLTQFDHHANRHMRTWGPQKLELGVRPSFKGTRFDRELP